MSGGVNSPVHAFKSVGRQPILIDFVKGSHMWDRDGNSNKHNDVNGMVFGASIIGGIHKDVFDKDFSSLGTELDLGRVSSPRLNMVVQSLLIGESSLISGET